jgi:hypothetical protein
MHRRKFLQYATPAALFLTAGCTSAGTDGEPTAAPTTTSTRSTATSSEPSTTTAPSLTILEEDLIHEGSGEEASVRVRLRVANRGQDAAGQVVASATFIEDNVLLDSWVATVNGLDAGQEWLVSIRSGGTSGEDAAAVDDVQVELEERSPPSALGSDRIEIVEDELVVEGGETLVEGVAKNVGEERLEYATVVATFAGEDGVLLGAALTDTTRDVDPGQRFQFSVRYAAPVRAADAVAGYQLTSDADVEA